MKIISFFKHQILFILIVIITLLGVIFSPPNYAQYNYNRGSHSQEENTPNWSEMVVETEKRWQADYEQYFSGDFANKNMTGAEIAKELLEIKTKSNKNAGVIWIKTTPQELVILLTMPGQKSIGYKKVLRHPQEIARKIKVFVQEITQTKASNRYLELGKELYDELIQPIQSELQANDIDTLILCLGEGLRSLPFSALYDGQQFLIEKYALVRVPAFNLTQISRADNLQNSQVLAMGASEFKQQQPLPGVAVELKTILQTPWAGVSVLNQNFTVNNLKALRKKEYYPIVHLATHADFLPGNPSNSYIQFSDRKLTLANLKELGLNDPPVELLVLSACQTAVGNKEVELGFSGLALQAGVRSVIASFWPVSDAGTLALMSEFYQRLKITADKSEALRQAQLAMVKGQVYLQGGELISSRGSVTLPETLNNNQTSLSHPFYWAGFSLIGSPW
ncbi:MAG: CHAT domain-containing protein [Microcystaceae cyanobacterium]